MTALLDPIFKLDPADCFDKISKLTPRETQIARGLSFGQTQNQIADELGISIRTVTVFVGKLKKKLGLTGPKLHGVGRIWFCAAMKYELVQED